MYSKVKNKGDIIPRIFRMPTEGIHEEVRRLLRESAGTSTVLDIRFITSRYRGILRGIARKGFELLVATIEIQGFRREKSERYFEVIDESLGLPIVRINKKTFKAEVLVQYKEKRFYIGGIKL